VGFAFRRKAGVCSRIGRALLSQVALLCSRRALVFLTDHRVPEGALCVPEGSLALRKRTACLSKEAHKTEVRAA
jgi:hypothetical protein